MVHNMPSIDPCLSMADPNVAHPQSFPSLRESVSTIRNYIFCSQLPYRTPATDIPRVSVAVFPKFAAELDVCSLLHCAVTLPLTLTAFNWPQSVFTAGHMQSMLCVDSPHVSEEPCACAYTCAKLPFRYDNIHRTF